MPIGKQLKQSVVAVGGLSSGILAYLGTTTTIITPLAEDDPLWRSQSYSLYNPHRNAATQDVCIKRIPLRKVKPELLHGEGDLVVEFCRGVWGGLGYRPQRAYLSHKYHTPQTSSHLWTVPDLQTSPYDIGTLVTDHFEVVDKTPTSITFRCGDTPRNPGPRDSDGLFVISAEVDKTRREVILGLKSCFFNSRRKLEGEKGPMPWWMELMHRWYARLWMVTGAWNVTGR